jgi:metacaspase-1
VTVATKDSRPRRTAKVTASRQSASAEGDAAENENSSGGLALCVGINVFENLPASSRLHGCVNDANDYAAALQECLGFAKSDITVLTDAKASKSAVMDALNGLVTRAKAGETKRLVFTYSSHGTQVPDPSGDEPDRADEAIAAYDIRPAGDSWDLDTVIVDDELQAVFSDLPNDVLVEVFLDTCNSGTGLRASDLIAGRQPKFLPAPTLDGEVDLSQRFVVRVRELLAAPASGAPAPVLFAACADDQTAADALINGRYNGAFTFYLLQTIRAGKTANRRALLKQVRSRLRTNRFTQRPQLEAAGFVKRAPIGEPG